MLNTPKFSNDPSELLHRLTSLRSKMKEKGASFCLIRATDRYLNEYVPVHKSRRAFITGFTGSLGDALVGLDTAYLFVDGRYSLQAKQQAPHFDVRVLPLGVSIESAWLDVLKQEASKKSVLLEFDRIDVSLFERISKVANAISFKVSPDDGIVDVIKGSSETATLDRVWKVDERFLGTSLAQRLDFVADDLKRSGLNGFLLVALDDIAWMSGYRGSDFDYQVTFAAQAIVWESEIWLITPHVHFESAKGLRVFTSLEDAIREFPSNNALTLGFDPSSTPCALHQFLEKKGVKLRAVTNPVQQKKAIKNSVELDHMYDSFGKADDVVFETQSWVCEQVMRGTRLTEADVDAYVRAQFQKSGTVALSFTPICGFAKNGAVIHHSVPDKEIALKEGELFLLDTGGIYEGGYATDLTRTFLIGDANTRASSAQKFMYTLVLKASIAGMSARLPQGTTGVQLDAIVRAPFWQLGLNYAHGTGHGVGINVHEFPPRIATFGTAVLEPGHVFSIEPGLYMPGFGGVRIENLCTLVKDSKIPGYVRVLPLTFALLDERLIENEMLTAHERSFLAFFKKRFEKREKNWNLNFELDEVPSEIMTVFSASND